MAIGDAGWPKSWSKTHVGKLARGLFASPRRARALGRQPVRADRLHGATFLMPVYGYHGQVVRGGDGCPLGHAHRRVGTETENARIALELAQDNDQLIFVPKLAARPFVEQGTLVEIRVHRWRVHDDLYLFCHPDRVRARTQRSLIASLRPIIR